MTTFFTNLNKIFRFKGKKGSQTTRILTKIRLMILSFLMRLKMTRTPNKTKNNLQDQSTIKILNKNNKITQRNKDSINNQ